VNDPSPPRPTLYEPESIAIATFLGSPIAGSILWALNENRIGRTSRALAALGGGALAFALILGIGQFLPLGAANGLNIGLVFGVRQAASAWRDRARDEGLAVDPIHESRWKAAGLGVLCLVLLLGGFLAVDLWGPDSVSSRVEIRPGAHVYYQNGVDADEARRFGEQVRTLGLFDGDHEIDIMYERIDRGHAVSMIVTRETRLEPGMDEEFQTFTEQVRELSDPGGTTELRLCNDLWTPHHTYTAR
jgi:hypothetical protein